MFIIKNGQVELTSGDSKKKVIVLNATTRTILSSVAMMMRHIQMRVFLSMILPQEKQLS